MKNGHQPTLPDDNIDSLRLALKKTKEELQIALKTIEQLQQAQRDIYEFLHILCNYEIKTPLSLIIGYADVLQKETNESFTKEQKAYLAIIVKHAQGIMQILDMTLYRVSLDAYISRPDIGLDLQEIDLEEIVDFIVPRVRKDIAQFNVHLENLPKVRASYGSVHYILSVIVWALSDGGANLAISASNDDNRVTIKIENPAFTLPQSMLDDFTSSAPLLTFIGQNRLKICRRLAEIQGGEMHLDSQKESGTVATFALPIFKQ